MDLTALIVFAAEAAEHEEPSKTAFYIVGAILAAWAVLVGAYGVTRHDFPGTQSAMRGVCAISAVLVAATLATAVLTS